MENDYYFPPTTPNPLLNEADKKVDELRELSYEYCTVWYNNITEDNHAKETQVLQVQ